MSQILKVSEIVLPARETVKSVWDMPSIETDTDALRVLGDYKAVWLFIEQFGNCLCWLDGNTYRVPLLCDKRTAYIDAKRKDCAIHGCE